MSAKRKTTGSSASSAPKKKAASPRPDEMSADLVDFITAIDEYKRQQGRPFPNWSEVLEILKELGYEKTPAG
ncbi:MAG: hypothetical protein ACI8QZ_001096 [Chlamydiales bacterium]|jgi:hypothetical protein